MKRLSKKQMIIFAIGQLGWSMLSGIISAWLVYYFLPNSESLKSGAIPYLVPGLLGGFITVLGIITATSRIFDAVTDPLIASLSDRSKNPKGRRIPFMRIAAIPLSVVTVLLFCAPFGGQADGGNVGNIIWISVVIVLFYAFMTMYCSKECVDLFDVLSRFEAGQTSKEDAQKVLQGMDQNKMKMLKNSMANTYKKIIAEDKPVEIEEEVEPIKSEVDKQIAGETVKKAVYNATRESGKNVPRSIVSRKH